MYNNIICINKMNPILQFAKICSETYDKELTKDIELYGFIIKDECIYIKVSYGTYHNMEDIVRGSASTTLQRYAFQKLRECPTYICNYVCGQIEQRERRRRAAAI